MFDLIKRNLLRNVMLADGVVSLVAGAALAAFNGIVSALLGPALPAGAVMAIGIFLIGWGIFHLASARTAEPGSIPVKIAIAGDALWVAASLLLVFYGWSHLTGLGVAVVLVMAVAVADIMLIKQYGLRQSRLQAAG
jgi:hypothetical protein